MCQASKRVRNEDLPNARGQHTQHAYTEAMCMCCQRRSRALRGLPSLFVGTKGTARTPPFPCLSGAPNWRVDKEQLALQDVHSSQLLSRPDVARHAVQRLNEALAAYVGQHSFHSFACAKEVGLILSI